MGTVETEVTSYRFTLPSADLEAFNRGSYDSHCTPVTVGVHVLNGGDIRIELGDPHMRPIMLSLEQFNQLRSKLFEVTGKVV